MLRIGLKKLKHFVITFRLSIIIIFSTLFVLGILSLIVITHYRLLASAEAVAFKIMGERSESIDRRIDTEVTAVKSEAQYTAYLLQSGLQNLDDFPALSKITYGFLKTQASILPSVQAVFYGNQQGDFVRSAIQNNGSVTSQVIKFHKPSKISVYDPRQRPWYIQAQAAKQTITTDLDQYANFGQPAWGVTVAAPVYKNTKLEGVFGLHLRVDYFRKFIESIPVTTNGKIFIVTDNGQIVAFPKLVQYENTALKTIDQITTSGIAQSFVEFKATGKKEFYFNDASGRYLAAYNPIQTFGQHQWLIGIVIPETDFIGTIIKTSITLSLIGLLILIAGLFIISQLSSHIVRPLKKLTDEANHIKNFELGNKITITSHIKEINQLTDSLNSMKKGLRSFQKYVPAKLVKEIMEAGDDAKVGGAKREIVTFFSDIKGFTGITERENPEILMPHLCDYFDEVSKIIQQKHGTIDKYIGDAVMAFWGAPQLIDNPANYAAKTALDCNKKLNELNNLWHQKKLPVLTTRIGLNVGDAIIGNLGSNDRLNYTAIGDAVNVASRLQDSNKIYGTSILVSESFFKLIKDDFILRKVDYVLLKGKLEPSFIYELLAENKEHLDFDIEHYNSTFNEGFDLYQNGKWNDAIMRFDHCTRIFPDDMLTLLLIKRCERFKFNPPSSTWRGEWRIGWETF